MIEGKKIRLRPFITDDAKFITELKSDFEGYKAFAGPPFPSNTESEKEWIGNMYPKGLPSSIYFAIEEKDNKDFSGYCVAATGRGVHPGPDCCTTRRTSLRDRAVPFCHDPESSSRILAERRS